MNAGLNDIHNIIAQDRARLRTSSQSADQSPSHQPPSPDINKRPTSADKAKSSKMPGSPHSPTNQAKARLTNEQKKKNHIESEKKRRDAIRAGFDRLADVVPGMQGQGRSEAVVLQHTVAYMKGMIEKRKAIDAEAIKKGWNESQTLEVYLQAEREVRAREQEFEAAKARQQGR
ncbi:unnamed protein product [Zymoseptoria tritici ST99CH_1A5]|nr:uncharacterized protein MYCGRDRAFT_70836 [Zymoseptoria tritici IPO323]EGP87872.1 hypothetical protein MYCGRDRAFT_70836 [Zymoseptoria tritici IPO323]SMR50693.1 unnamed protein product [Zymoseptoria tritici ST99CH_1E4]SMY23398.1 unnamed protein product [Zymoseptoria tritici ST99CH_1A5]